MDAGHGRSEAAWEAAQRAALTSLLSRAKTVDVPEPSPLFWDHFSSRVRAAIVDRDRSPSWQPVTADVEAFFAPLGDRELTFP